MNPLFEGGSEVTGEHVEGVAFGIKEVEFAVEAYNAVFAFGGTNARLSSCWLRGVVGENCYRTCSLFKKSLSNCLGWREVDGDCIIISQKDSNLSTLIIVNDTPLNG